jgi:error-prone DNA polymerase
VVFITIEDETGIANLILWSTVYERFRRAARYATLLQAEGYVQREGQVVHVLAKRLFDRSDLLLNLEQPSRDFH